MLYYLFDWFKRQNIHFPGSGLFEFITFRVLLAMLLSLVIATLFGRRLINYLRRKQVGESVRDLGLAGEQTKKGTPTMGGIIIILSILRFMSFCVVLYRMQGAHTGITATLCICSYQCN